ncbi:hypothetical protein M6B38_141310 [Iris pallida]|uniref:Uncharacterized protein n=1 Tax=Iris pallida TaxID=29817 RepID=A0AAX6FDW5_IRIPA|nr:hypothetical protein M6B38_141310 [Iris pallida]
MEVVAACLEATTMLASQYDSSIAVGWDSIIAVGFGRAQCKLLYSILLQGERNGALWNCSR